MSFTYKEPLQPKLTAMPASRDVDALVRAEHHDPFSILGPHDDEQGGQFIRAFLPEALSVHVLARDSGGADRQPGSPPRCRVCLSGTSTIARRTC